MPEKALIAGTVPETDKAKDNSAQQGSLLAGGGVAIAALSSSLAFVLKTLAGLTPLKIIVGFLSLFLAFTVPAAILAYIKLKNRDLSAVLEGNGWGINDRMKLTLAQARQFTQAPRHPGFVGKTFQTIVLWLALFGSLGTMYAYRDSLLILFG